MDNGESSYRRFLDGENDAFGEILDMYRENLIFFINRTVNDLAVAEDIAADSFAELIIHKRRFGFKSSLKTYLFTIARNKAVSYIRHAAKYRTVDIDGLCELSDEYASFEREIEKDEQKAMVNKALSAMKDDYKTALHLVYFEELSYADAAKVMKKSPKQIENILYRARQSLRSELEKEGFVYEE